MGGQSTIEQACMRSGSHLCAYGDLGEVDIDGIWRIKDACWGQWHVGGRLDLSQTCFAVQPAHKVHGRSHITCIETSAINRKSSPSQQILVELCTRQVLAQEIVRRKILLKPSHVLPISKSSIQAFMLMKLKVRDSLL